MAAPSIDRRLSCRPLYPILGRHDGRNPTFPTGTERRGDPLPSSAMQRALVFVLVLAASFMTAPAALGATLATTTRCYQELQDVVVSGTGYAPMGKIAISRDGEPFGTADADAAGNFTVKFPAAELGRGVRESVSPLTAIDAALNTASTRYRTSKIFADFAPAKGDPRTLTVRFEVNGFGLLRRNASVYLHYINPRGKGVRTVRLGT